MRLEPVVAHAVVDHQAHLEGGGGFHAFGDDGRDALLFGTEHVDDQFVVYLKDHLRPDAFGRETAVDIDHGDLHDVGRGSLDRGVHGIALGQATRHGVVRGDVVEIAAAAEDRRDDSVLPAR